MTAIGALITPWGVLMAAVGRMTSDDFSKWKDGMQKLGVGWRVCRVGPLDEVDVMVTARVRRSNAFRARALGSCQDRARAVGRARTECT